MDPPQQITRLRQQHEQQNEALLNQLNSTVHQINITTQKYVEENPRGRQLYKQRQDLSIKLEERRELLRQEFSSKERRLNDEFLASRAAVDQQLMKIGVTIGGVDSTIKALLAERDRLQNSLQQLAEREVGHLFNMVSREDALLLDNAVMTRETPNSLWHGDSWSRSTPDTTELASNKKSLSMESNSSTPKFSSSRPKSDVLDNTQSRAQNPYQAQELSGKSRSNTTAPLPGTARIKDTQASLAHVQSHIRRDDGRSVTKSGVFKRFAKQLTPHAYSSEARSDTTEVTSAEDEEDPGTETQRSRHLNVVGNVTQASTMRITQEQFEKIAETYSHACLREGVVYLRNCRLCGYNATRDVRPESTGSHFIRGDAGLLSHVGSFHSERPLTKEDLHQTCKEERVGYNDAVLMSKGIPPKGVVMIRNATYDMPYEQFKRKRQLKEPARPIKSKFATQSSNQAPATPKPSPSDFFTIGSRIKESGKRTLVKRSDQQLSSFRIESTDEDTITVKKNPTVIVLDDSDGAENSDTSDYVPPTKRLRTTRGRPRVK